ncbi:MULTISPECIES: FkbM family methyltransferase [unclassified Brevundimonas]|uniref:FkbM family methyltransferase n=1 Tax=unclassified Brevundimonas TaxID=2622653 RepID=UPI0025BDD648|nr:MULTISPECIES: FkbM family methyltransferase [unclassified Brevundimonas]
MEIEIAEFVDWETLCTWDDPTHMMREWGGVIDPVKPMEQPLLQNPEISSKVHEEDFYFLGKFRNAQQFVDIGANCGQSINSYRLLNPHTPIVSFEPNPVCYRVLTAYTAHQPNVRTYPFGLSDTNAFLELYTPVIDRLMITPLATTQRDLYRTGWGADWFRNNRHERRIAIYAERLAFFQGDAFNLHPDIIKIDVEGAELLTLTGILKTILKHRPVIMAEGTHTPEYIEFFKMLDYSPWQWTNNALHQFDPNEIERWGKRPDNTIYIHNPDLERHARENGFEIRYL